MATFSIYQLATPNIDAYAKFSIASVKSYAKKNGYQHHVLRDQVVADLHINWSKIAMMIEGLNTSKSDYCVLLDADTVIVNHQISLEKMLPPEGKIIAFARDNYYKRLNRPNAGFVVIRNSTQGIQILKEWLHAAYHEGKEWADIHPRNQNVYWKFLESKWADKQSLIPLKFCRKYYKMYDNPFFQRFIYHITYSDTSKRTLLMSKLLSRFVPGSSEQLQLVEEILSSQKKGVISIVS